MRYIDYAKIRNYDIKNLLHYELTTSFFLTKDGYLRKPRKSDLATKLRKLYEERCSQSLPATLHKQMRANLKANLKTFFDLCSHLWSTFMQLSKDSTGIGIIFDLYHDKIIKGIECSLRARSLGKLTKVTRNDQPLHNEMEKF